MSNFVLVVDDDPDNRESVAALLEMRGYRVDMASCVQDALTKLLKRSYAAVVTDYQMPDGFGLEVVGACRELLNRPTIVVMSGVSGVALQRLRQLAAEYGADLVLSKPIRPDELLASLARPAARQAVS